MNMIGVSQQLHLSLIMVAFQPDNPLFNASTKSGADLETFLVSAVLRHGVHL